ILVNEARCLRGPLTADHYEIALWQHSIERGRSAELAEPGRQRGIWLGIAADSDHSHAERRAHASGVTPDPPGTHDTCRLAFQKNGPVGAMGEFASVAIDGGAVEALCEVQNGGHRIFRDRQRVA